MVPGVMRCIVLPSHSDSKPEVPPDSEDVEERSMVAGEGAQRLRGFGFFENVTFLEGHICFFVVLGGLSARSLIFCNNSTPVIALGAVTFVRLLASFRSSTFFFKAASNSVTQS